MDKYSTDLEKCTDEINEKQRRVEAIDNFIFEEEEGRIKIEDQVTMAEANLSFFEDELAQVEEKEKKLEEAKRTVRSELDKLRFEGDDFEARMQKILFHADQIMKIAHGKGTFESSRFFWKRMQTIWIR